MRNGNGKPAANGPAAPREIRCAVYTRKSTDEGLQQEFNSLDAQREAAEAFIASQKHEGWQLLPDHYDDGGFTGGNMDRPAVQRLLAAIEAHRVDCVVVYKVDRLSRSLLDFARMMAVFDRHDVSFVSVTQQFNTTNSLGRLTLNILLSFAQFEREIISERTRDKQSAARKKGKWIGGHPVLGYDIDPRGGRLVVNAGEAPMVRGIFELYLENEAAIPVTEELERRGWRTKRWESSEGRVHGGKPFTKNRLYAVLTNVIYSGRINHKGTIYAGEHEAIVDVATWERVQKMLGRNGPGNRERVRNKYGALLRGMVHCTSCGVPMLHTYTMRKSKRYRYYVCYNAQQRGWNICETKSVAAHSIEEAVIESIRKLGTNPELARETVQQARAQVATRIEQLKREESTAKERLRRLNVEIARTAATSDQMDGAARCDRLVEAQKEFQTIESQLTVIRTELETLNCDPLDELDLMAALCAFDPVWTSMRTHEQTRLLRLLVESVGYDGRSRKVTVAFRSPGMRELCAGVAAGSSEEKE
jgi:site-specific DNA recombinase